jgi:HK97 family phage major capsid protein
MTSKTPIPESADELAEILGDDKRRQEIFATAEDASEFLGKYVKATQKGAMKQELDEAVQTGIRTALEEWGVQDINRPNIEVNLTPESRPVNKFYNPQAKGAGRSKDGRSSYEDEFTDTADFFQSIWHSNHAGEDKWRRIRNDYSSLDAATGGFLVPENLRAELLRVSLESAIVRSRARTIPMDSARVPFPTIDATSNASSVYGGIVGYWTEEGGTMTESEATFGRIVLDASKLTAYCEVPNELLQDSIVSFGALIDQLLPSAIAWFEDVAFLRGSGVGQPLGVMLSDALVSVAKETGQVADTIVWENLVKMYARMLPGSLGSAVWVANIDTFPQLATMSLAVGTGGSAIWLNNGVVGPPMTILGRPLIFTEKMETIGGGGSGKDIAFLDFSYYLVGDRQQMRAESSPHYQFKNDITAYRITERVDGRGWLASAITPNKGTNTLSPFVTLDERA